MSMYVLEASSTDPSFGRTFGIFTTLEKAQEYVKDALGLEIKWSKPSSTVTGGVSSGWTKGVDPGFPNKTGILWIHHLPVDPAEFSNDLRYGLMN